MHSSTMPCSAAPLPSLPTYARRRTRRARRRRQGRPRLLCPRRSARLRAPAGDLRRRHRYQWQDLPVASFVRQIWTMPASAGASMGTLGVRDGATADRRRADHPRCAQRCTRLCRRSPCAGASTTSPWKHRATASISAGWTASTSRPWPSPISAATISTITPTWTTYRNAKLRLFSDLLVDGGAAIVNVDDPEYEPFMFAAPSAKARRC